MTWAHIHYRICAQVFWMGSFTGTLSFLYSVVFSSFSLSHFPFLLESFDRHVSHHLHSIHDSGFFLYNDVHNVFHASLNCFPRSTITLYICFCNHTFLWLPARITSSGLSSYAWPIMLKSFPSNRLILFRVPVHLPLICVYKSYNLDLSLLYGF